MTQSAVWSSEHNNVATVDARGYVTPKSPGVTRISATSPSGQILGASTVTVTAATLDFLTIDPANPALAVGTTRQLTVTGLYSDGSRQDVTRSVSWSSSDPTRASAADNGVLTGLAVGTTVLSARLNGVAGSVTVTVTPAFLVGLSITPVNTSVAVGSTQQFVAIGTYSDGSTQDLTASAQWKSSDARVAALSNATGSVGKASALATGTTVVSATSGEVAGQATLTVTPAYPVSLAITPHNPQIALGTALQLQVIATYSDGSTRDLTASVTWTTSAANVAAVSNASGSVGKVTAVAVGSAALTATLPVTSPTSGTISGATTLTVTPAYPVSLAITPANPQAALGTALQLRAIGTYSDGSTQDLTAAVTWSSSDAGVAVVSNAPEDIGKVTTVSAGVATARAVLPVNLPVPSTISDAVSVTVTPEQTASIDGVWVGTYTIYDDPADLAEIGTYSFEVIFQQDGTTITAMPTLRGKTTGNGGLFGRVTGNEFRFSFTYISPQSGVLLTDTGTGSINGTTMTGNVVEAYEKGYNCSYTFNLTKKQ